MRKVRTISGCVLLLLASGWATATAADPEVATEQEIAHLILYLQRSGCEFNRNGSWYDPPKAVEHIERKYRYLIKREMIDSAEQFIDRAASRSSMSGKAYLVKCGDSEPVESAVWFGEELTRFRAATREGA